jgi:hypothetical protein
VSYGTLVVPLVIAGVGIVAAALALGEGGYSRAGAWSWLGVGAAEAFGGLGPERLAACRG